MSLDIYFFHLVRRRVSFCSSGLFQGGRNFLGRICVFHRARGNKRLYSSIDEYRRLQQFGRITRIFRCTFRTSLLALVSYDNGLLSFIALSQGVHLGSTVASGVSLQSASLAATQLALISQGSAVPLFEVPLFTQISNVELYNRSGFILAKAAGLSATFSGREGAQGWLKLSSGWQVNLSLDSFCVLGSVSNPLHKYERIGKAGKAWALGRRPIVRGVAKNPCDHPHGGGEGKASKPRAPVTPWGKLTKGTPTKATLRDVAKRRQFKNLAS